MKRSGKFYRNNEASVMKRLGFTPTPNSGSGWIVKEDGENEDIVCQLKSTDASSIRVYKKDMDTLVYHALVSHKLPLFVIQFLQSNEVYFLVRPIDLYDIAQSMFGGEKVNREQLLCDIDVSGIDEISVVSKKCIKSSSDARRTFIDENDSKFKKRSKSAK